MVWTRSMATSPKHQESENAFSLSNRALAPQSASIQQQLLSMVAAMVDLMQQNQELTREVNSDVSRNIGKTQKIEGRRTTLKEEINSEVSSLEVCYIWREKWTRWRIPWGGQTMWMISSTKLTLPSLRPSRVILYPPSSKCLLWTHTMEHEILVITLPRSRQPCTSKAFQMKSYVEPSLLRRKAQPGCGLVNYHQTL